MFVTLKQSILTNTKLQGLTISETDMLKVHQMLATKTFRAYSGFRWLEEFSKVKKSSNDTTNMAMRNVMQLTGSADGSSSKSSSDSSSDKTKKPKAKKRPLASALLGTAVINPATVTNSTNGDTQTPATTSQSQPTVNPQSDNARQPTLSTNATNEEPASKKRRKNRTEQEYKDEYAAEKCIKVALTKLQKACNIVEKANLSIKECCSVLWVCFNKFHKSNSSMNKARATTLLKEALAEGTPFIASEHLRRLALDG